MTRSQIIAAVTFAGLVAVSVRYTPIPFSWKIVFVIMAIVGGSAVLFFIVVAQKNKAISAELKKKLALESLRREKMQQMIVKLDATSQIGMIVNKIVHDIRGPLGAVGGFIRLIQEQNQLTPDSNRDCEIMMAELNRISNLLSHLISYAKPDRLEKAMVCPVTLMETILSVVAFYPGAKDIAISRNFPDKNRVWIFATKEELQQIIFNLLKNSVEAVQMREQEKNISITISADPNFVLIEVKDNGFGISPEIMSQLFKTPVSTKEAGGGIGLLIVKEMLESYNGKISIQSDVGRGTRVTIKLPRYASSTDDLPAKTLSDAHQSNV